MTLSRTPIERSELYSSVEITPCSVDKFDEEDWSRAAELLEHAVSRYSDVDMFAILSDVADGTAQLWAITDEAGYGIGAMVTRVVEYPSEYTVFMIQLCGTEGGRMTPEAMQTATGHLEEVARHLGCDAVRICGRKGWGRILQGYVEVERTFDKVLRKADD